MSDPTRDENYRGVFDTTLGFGNRPAVIVVDFVKAYTTPGAPFFGQGVVEAVQHSVPLLEAARAANVPVFYTQVVYHPSGADGGLFFKKVPALKLFVQGAPLGEIDSLITPHPQDFIITKQYPSCFFGTSLSSTLGTKVQIHYPNEKIEKGLAVAISPRGELILDTGSHVQAGDVVHLR